MSTLQDQNRSVIGRVLGSTTATLVSPKKEIPAKVEQLQHMFNDMENSVRRLIDSARPISRIAPPSPTGEVSASHAQETELGSALEMIRIRMANLDADINAAIDRIEL